MSRRDLPEEEIRRRVQALSANNGNVKKTAAELGIARSSLQSTVARAVRASVSLEEPVELPDFGDEDEPIEEVIERAVRSFERSKRSHDARKWFEIKIKDNKPIGVIFVGDPHVDDNGCNWPVLKHHAELAKTSGVYAVNIGDSANYWGGRLIRKYADQDTSARTARRLVEWLLLHSGFRWIVWLMGNHEHMSDAAPLLLELNKRFGTQRVPMLDWEARFVLQFPNGQEFRINAAHNHAGHSMWNPLHGQVKAAKFGDRIDIVVSGHLHNWGVSQWENPEQGHSPLMIRVRGYKHMDDYARRIGKAEQEEGQSVMVIFDPNASTRSGMTQAFVDLDKGVNYLRQLRGE
jgi:hypothetical protein